MYLLFWLSGLLLFYEYIGYLLLLRMIFALGGGKHPEFKALPDSALPTVTVLLTVHNEERHIRTRLDNLLSQDYPKGKLFIVVASDGSTDDTNRIVNEYAQRHNVRLLASDRLGKSGVQNAAMFTIDSEIVLLTDAEARFEIDYIREMVKPFTDAAIGCVTAHLRFESIPGVLARGQGYYWLYELRLRQLESDLGILAVASGQAMAFRQQLFVPLPSNVGDDCIIPLDVVMQGYKVVHQPEAHAYDVMENEADREFRSRVRMTMRNWTGTWMRPRLLNPLACPGYAFALWSHKLLRWVGSVFLVALTVSAVSLAVHWYLPAWGFIVFCLLATAEFLKQQRAIKLRLPFGDLACSFMVANIGFLLGLTKAIIGQKVTFYRAGR